MTKNKKSNSSDNYFNRLFLRKKQFGLLTAAVLVAVSGFVGYKVVYGSHAAGNIGYYCPMNDYFQYNPPYHYQVCVAEIQQLLNVVGRVQYYNGYSPLSVDGKFGPATAAQVAAFQKYTRQYPQYISGAVLSYPQYNGYWSGWRVLCGYDLASTGNRASALWNQTGCDRIPQMPFN